MLFKDPQLKAERGYTDPRSYVRNDGSEVLYGSDWKQRKQELEERSGGRCEYIVDLHRCVLDGAIPAHIIPRYPKRDDQLSNIKLYCFEHDRQTEQQAWRKTRFGEGQKPIRKRAMRDQH